MIVEIKIPAPGESITEVELKTWFVKSGSYVVKNQELAEIESDKATLTLNASEAGVVTLLIPENKTVKVGAIACSIDTSAMVPESLISIVPPLISELPKSEIKAVPEEIAPIKITPVARQLLNEKGVSIPEFLAKLERITAKDVELVLNAQTITDHKTPEPQSRIQERKTMSALRKKLSQRLVAVKNETAMLTTFNEVDMSKVMAIRLQYKDAFEKQHGVKLGFMSFFTKAASLALLQFPNVNAMLDGDEIVYFNYSDIGIAVQTPKGLMVPVIRNVNQLTIPQIELSISQMALKAREAKISLDEMSGGTFSITNGGVFGSMLSTPIINPPQAAILGMHAIKERPVAENGQVVIKPIMYVALSYDHRIIDGKDSVGFLVKLKDYIEHPEKMMLDSGDIYQKLVLG